MPVGKIWTVPLTKARTLLSKIAVNVVREYYVAVWGMKIGKGTRISLTAKLDKTFPAGIEIGEYTAITFQAAVLTHDFHNLAHKTTKIGSYCLIGARSIIMPGVRIGDHCVIGAGSIVMTNVPSNCLAIGNPARVIDRNIRTTHWGIREDAYTAALAADQARKEGVQLDEKVAH